MSVRAYWGWTLTAAVTVSVAGNVGHALLTATPALRGYAAVAAALPPLALLTVTEGLARSVGRGVRRWAYWVGMIGAAAIAMLAFVLSFAALRDLAIALGQPRAVAAGWPLLADATIAVSSIMLLAVKPVQADVPAVRQPAEPAHHLDQQHVPAIDWQAPVDMAGTVAAGQPVSQQRSAAAPTMTSTDDHPGHHPLHLVPTAAGPGAGGAGPTDAVEQQARQLVEQGVTRLPANQVAEVLRCSARGASQRSIGRELSIDRRTVAGIVSAAAEESEAVGV